MSRTLLSRMLRMRQVYVLGATLILTAPLAGQAVTTTTSTTGDFNTHIFPSCQGELIAVTGQRHVVTHTTVTEQGLTSTVFHLNLHGSGIGLVSGRDYQFTQTSTRVFNRRTPAPIEFTLSETIHVVSAGSADDFRARTLVHVTVSATGETTAQVLSIDRVCN